MMLDSTVCKSNLKYLYWSFAQQLAHHTINGCNMRTGDICGTGTISGPSKDSFGSMLELSWNGSQNVTLDDGTHRTYLNDGDEVKMTGFCKKGDISLGFGECTGKLFS
jgi:fumarylacetoacetase